MCKNAIIIFLVCMVCTTCTTISPDKLSEIQQGLTASDSVCYDTQFLTRSLHIQKLDEEGETTSELLNSLGIKVIPDRSVRLVAATRISGHCSGHIDEFRIPIIHFDTGATLLIDQGQFFSYSKEYYPINFIDINDAHPEISSRRFIQAIDIGGGHKSKGLMINFIGAWISNKRSIITPYKKLNSGVFYVYDDLLELDKVVSGIRFLHHLDTPSGLIQILQEDGGDKILLEFMWVYSDLFSEKID